MTFTLQELAEKLGLALEGDGSIEIKAIAAFEEAAPGEITFLSSPKLLKKLEATKASAVIVKAEHVAQAPCAALISDNPYLSYAQLSKIFSNYPETLPEIHSAATVHESASLGSGVYIGPNAVIEKNVVVEDGAYIGANCFIGEDCVVGQGSHLHPNVTFYHNVRTGKEVNIHSGAVIGGDGFGFAPRGQDKGWEKIYQLGGVVLGDFVDVGCNTTIDRGALSDTKIGNGVILDNQIQIGHNCVIGDNTAVAACAAIAGSAVIGKNCTISGATAIAGHLEIVDNVHITGMTMVPGSIWQAGTYSSGTSISKTPEWRKNAVRFNQLDKLFKKVKELEKNLSKSSSSTD